MTAATPSGDDSPAMMSSYLSRLPVLARWIYVSPSSGMEATSPLCLSLEDGVNELFWL